MNPQRFRSLFFPVRFFFVLAAEVNNCGDTELFELQQARISWLSAAVQAIINFSGIGDTGNPQLFSIRGAHDGWPGGLRLRREWRRKSKDKHQREKGKKAIHVGLDASILTRERSAPKRLQDRKSTRLNSSHSQISYAVFC